MDESLSPVKVKLLNDNIFKLLDDEWMLVTAGTGKMFNTMTASWGTFGILWNKPIAIIFIRPQRYTYELMNNSECFSLSILHEKYREALNICGSTSGKTINKIEKAGLKPLFTDKGTPYFSQARLVFECKKIYVDDLNPDKFINSTLIKEIYPKSDFHRMFFGEIINCLSSDKKYLGKEIKLSEEGDDM